MSLTMQTVPRNQDLCAFPDQSMLGLNRSSNTTHTRDPMMTAPTPDSILQTLLGRYSGTVAVDAWGETSLFYNPGRALPRGVYFATLKEKDGDNDRASDLNRPDIFRLNVGTSKPLFLERFGPPPPRPGKGQHIEGDWDFTAQDTVTPHPVYGWMSWVSVVTPSQATFDDLRPMIDAAYAKAVASFDKRMKTKPPATAKATAT